jgi:hypothetical protein
VRYHPRDKFLLNEAEAARDRRDMIAQTYLDISQDEPLPAGDGYALSWWLNAVGYEVQYLWHSQTQGEQGDWPPPGPAWVVDFEETPTSGIFVLREV